MKPRADVIIGFDSEWSPDTAAQTPHNVILSYQYFCLGGGREWSGIGYTQAGMDILHPGQKAPDRVWFGGLLSVAIEKGIKGGCLTRWPTTVIAAAHWTRADLSAMADYPVIKRRFDGVQKTYVTIFPVLWVHANVSGHPRRFGVRLLDTMLLVPGSQRSLAALGDLYGLPKIEPGIKEIVKADGTVERIPYIERMDLLLADDPELFEKYAIRDAEISARHTDGVWKFANDELELGLPNPPITLGSLAVSNLLATWRRQGVSINNVLDGGIEQVKRFDQKRRRYVTTKQHKHSPLYTHHEQLAIECFHGGRNECFAYGPTVNSKEEGTPPFREYDLIGAYAVALASIAMPNWQAMDNCRELQEFKAGVLGVARVGFHFPQGTRFPSLPIVAPNGYGLIYPLQGEAYATASEIAVARRQGAALEIRDGIIVPWCDDPCRPFGMVIEELQRRRNEHPRGSLPNEMFKQLSNSIYGKLGQGLKGTQAFDPRSESHVTIDDCPITNAYLAGYVSGQIRALISELLASTPTNRIIVSVTTDSLISNATIEEINTSGPVASFLATVKKALTGEPTLLEYKYEAEQLLPWRTRGIATLRRLAGEKPKLARGGMKEPGPMSIEEANDWFARSMLLREAGDVWASEDPLPFPFAHLTNADHVFQEVQRKVNFEYDMKREPVDVVPRYVAVPGDPDLIVQHIAFDTRPWRSLADFAKNRELFEKWLRHG